MFEDNVGEAAGDAVVVLEGAAEDVKVNKVKSLFWYSIVIG